MKKVILPTLICLIAISIFAVILYTGGSSNLQLQFEPLIESSTDEGVPYILQDSTNKIWGFFFSDRTDNGHAHIFYVTSVDGGISWSDASLFLPACMPGRDVQWPVAFEDSTGRFWVAWYNHTAPYNADQVWFTTSGDGVSWTPARLLCGGHNDLGGFIEAGGRIWFFFSPLSNSWRTCYKTTDDGGNTWSDLVAITASGRRFPHATVLSNGTIFVVYRIGTINAGANIGYSASSDGGLTWKSGIVDDAPDPGWDDVPRVVEYAGRIYVTFGRSYTQEGYEQDVWFRVWNGTAWENSKQVTNSSINSLNNHPCAAVINNQLWIAFQTCVVYGGPGVIDRDIWLARERRNIPAVINVDPDTLNLKSNGQWITAYITLPEGYNAEDIVFEKVYLNGISAVWSEIQDDVYMVKFDREMVQARLTNEPDYDATLKSYDLTLTITGELMDGTLFAGSDTIRVLSK